MAHFLRHAIPLQHTLLQLDDVFVFLLQARQGPELSQGQLDLLRRVAAELLDSHTGAGFSAHGLVDDPVASPTQLTEQSVPRCSDRAAALKAGLLGRAQSKAGLSDASIVGLVPLHRERP